MSKTVKKQPKQKTLDTINDIITTAAEACLDEADGNKWLVGSGLLCLGLLYMMDCRIREHLAGAGPAMAKLKSLMDELPE